MAPPPRPKSTTVPSDIDASVTPQRRSPWLFVALAVGALVLVVGLIAVLTAGEDEELVEGTVPATEPGGTAGGTGTTVPGATDAPSGDLAEAWPVTITGTALPELPESGADPAVGTTAPTLSGFTFDGTPVAVDPAKGPVMLVFLAHWCPHCQREVPVIVDWAASGDVPDGLQVIAVTTAVVPDRENFPPSAWMEREAWPFPVLADSAGSEAAQAFGLSGFPFSVVIDTDGTVLGRVAGELGAQLPAWVADTLAR